MDYITRRFPDADKKEWGKFHIECYRCGEPLTLVVDASQGPPSEVGTECSACGAVPVYRVNWWYEVELQEMKRDDENAYSRHERQA